MSTKIIPFPVTARPASQAPRPPETALASTVTFTRPFQLPGMDLPHAPGTFELRTLKEPLDVSWPAYRLSTRLLITDGTATEALDVTAADLDAALREDARELG